MSLPTDLSLYLHERLGLPVQQVRALGGGCIHHATRVETEVDTFFLKYNRPDQAHNFEAEAAGLTLLAAHTPLGVPRVLATGTTGNHAFLLLQFVEQGPPARDYWEQLGRGLAVLHQHSAPAFGLDSDNYIGSLPQVNGWRSAWVDFFMECRVQPMQRLARARGLLSNDDERHLDRLRDRLAEWMPAEEPALIHGDLWGGNLLCDAQGAPVLIDPAVSYSHREMELAFMTLFDRQPPAFYQAYAEVWPLQPGYRERFDCYNLYPLLVHLNLFGSSYYAAVRDILHRYA
ncbi:MAG: fructosamine kinase family protein [Bacteroidia bacterium]